MDKAKAMQAFYTASVTKGQLRRRLPIDRRRNSLSR